MTTEFSKILTTKEEILEKWNYGMEDITVHGLKTSEAITQIENRIASLLERDYFFESVQKMRMNSYCDWDGSRKALTDEEKGELKLYNEIFEWNEQFIIYSSWQQTGYTDHVHTGLEDGFEPLSLDVVKGIIESSDPRHSLSEPEEEDYSWEDRLSSFKVEIGLKNLRLRVTKKPSVREQLSEMSEKISKEGEKYQEIINELRTHKDDPSYHFEDIEHYFNLFISIPIGLTNLCKQLEAQLEEAN